VELWLASLNDKFQADRDHGDSNFLLPITEGGMFKAYQFYIRSHRVRQSLPDTA
jgi:hypothetical protein